MENFPLKLRTLHFILKVPGSVPNDCKALRHSVNLALVLSFGEKRRPGVKTCVQYGGKNIRNYIQYFLFISLRASLLTVLSCVYRCHLMCLCYILCVFVLPYIYLLYLMCICLLVCVYCCSYFRCRTAG